MVGHSVRFDDDWNARRLIERETGRYLYVADQKKWMVYESGRWVPDTKNSIIEAAKRSMRDLLADSADMARDEGNRAAQHATASLSKARLDAAVQLAQSDPEVAATSDTLDRNPWLLNVENGTIDLRTGKCMPHDPKHLHTKLAPVTHDPTAESPTFLKFIGDVFCGDTELIGDVQRLLGYCLTGDMSEHIFVFCWGIGANGKGTLLNAVVKLLGDYAQTLPLGTILKRQSGSQTNDIAALQGVRLALLSEFRRDARLDDALIKAWTGGDELRARLLYSEYRSFRPHAKLVVCGNSKPSMPADDNAYWRRVRLIPFLRTFKPEEQDHTLSAKLWAEAPGILNWLLGGLADYRSSGVLTTSSAISKATEGYRSETDSVAQFIDERCKRSSDGRQPARELWNAYCEWCQGNGEKRVSQSEFKNRAEQLGFGPKRTKAGYHYRGLRLLGDTEPPQDAAA